MDAQIQGLARQLFKKITGETSYQFSSNMGSAITVPTQKQAHAMVMKHLNKQMKAQKIAPEDQPAIIENLKPLIDKLSAQIIHYYKEQKGGV